MSECNGLPDWKNGFIFTPVFFERKQDYMPLFKLRAVTYQLRLVGLVFSC